MKVAIAGLGLVAGSEARRVHTAYHGVGRVRRDGREEFVVG